MMHPRNSLASLTCLTCIVIAGIYTPAAAETLLVPEEYPSVTAALNAAANGDTISLGPGNHTFSASTVLSGRTLTFEGRPNARIKFPPQNGQVYTITDSSDITFRNAAIRGNFLVTGNSVLSMENMTRNTNESYFDQRAVTADGAAIISVVDCELDSLDLANVPIVRIGGCAITGGRGHGASPTQDLGFPFGIIQGGPGHPGYDALKVRACPDVRVIDSSFLAGDGGGGISVTMSHFWGTFNSGPGGNGIVATEGTTVMGYYSTAIAGLHGTPVYGPTPSDGVAVMADASSSVTGFGPRVRLKNVITKETESAESETDR
jgi:hypothetical protein